MNSALCEELRRIRAHTRPRPMPGPPLTGLIVPRPLTVRRRGRTSSSLCEVKLAEGTVVLMCREAHRYRRFHARAMEQLRVVYAWGVDSRLWFYWMFAAFCRAASDDHYAGIRWEEGE